MGFGYIYLYIYTYCNYIYIYIYVLPPSETNLFLANRSLRGKMN